MRAIRTGSTLLATLLIPAAAAAQQFEGTVTYQMAGQGMTMEMVHHVRGEQVRQEINGPMGMMAVIVDRKAGTATVLMPAAKTYMKMDMKAMSEQVAAAGMDTTAAQDFEITATGETETIAGIRCEHYVMDQGEVGKVNICAAKGMGFYMAGGSTPGQGPGISAGGDWAERAAQRLRARFKEGFFPLKMTFDGPQGPITMTVTNLERKRIAEDMFVIPAGFTEMKMPGSGG
jgi:hypothetical protein